MPRSFPPPVPMKLPAWRAWLVLAVLLTSFAALIARAGYLQGIHNDFLKQKGESRYGRLIEISAHRGMVRDRNNEPLAISTPVEAVWANPTDIALNPRQMGRLAQLLGINPAELQKRLTADPRREFVYLKRQLPPDEAAKVVELGLPGIYLTREYRRYYPAGEVMAHVIGFTGVDDNGQEGMELAYQDWLAGKPGSRKVIKDRLGRIIEDVESVRVPQEGQDLVLSIDSKIQYLAYRELKSALAATQAKAGGVVVLDAKTGEVLALVNLPAYNPNNRERLDRERNRNRAVTDLFEPGSTLKPFTAAAALEIGAFKPDTLIQTAPGTMTIGSATIHDAHPHGLLSVAQVIQKSSNVGAAKIALGIPKEALWKVLTQAGFGHPPELGFPGEAAGKLRPPRDWRPIENATLAYGHGISVSLVQLARAYTLFTGDGELRPVSLVKRSEPPPGTPVVSPGTAREIRRMLEMVVAPGGTAGLAQVQGYRVAGKTGTAHKLEGGRYASHRYVASFVGFAPASDPRLVIAVMIDEPGAGQYYGGLVAAPVFSAIMGGALRLLGVAPDKPGDVALPVALEAEAKEEV